MKVALVHDYLTQRGGAERVFELLCQFFPSADIFTSLYDPEGAIELGSRPVWTSYLQNIPGATSHFRLLAPFYFSAFRSLDLRAYDLIISSTSSFAKAVRKREDAFHICLCHNVTRFLWDTQTYLKEYKHYQSFSWLIEQIFKHLRKIDWVYAQEPDIYLANSSTVARRIQKIYAREAISINYPIDSSKFVFSDQKENFYLVSSRLLSYKRIDIIVEAFNWLGWPLLIVGDGPEREYLESKALDNVQFLGYVSDEWRTSLMAKARAVIVAALEDYGLVPIEANASGTPVIAYGAGGVLDTQVPGLTGILFKQQTPQALIAALLEAENKHWEPAKIQNHALSNFSEQAFLMKFTQTIQEVLGDFCYARLNQQTSKKLLLGELLQRANLVSTSQIGEALRQQSQEQKRLIGEILVIQGWIKQETVEFFVHQWTKLLSQSQKSERNPIGFYFQQAGLLDQSQIEALLVKQKQIRPWVRFGKLAVSQGLLNQKTVDFFVEHFSPEYFRVSNVQVPGEDEKTHPELFVVKN